MLERTKGIYLQNLDTFLKLPRKVQERMWLDISDIEVDKKLFDVAYDFERYSQCESPIEVIFAYYYDRCLAESGKNEETFYMTPQETITTDNNKNYRVDFFLECYFYKDTEEYYSNLIIECDGHEFHEKTKQQVKKRNERDYDLKLSGYDVIHFSGSEIYNEPEKCVEKVLEYLKKNLRNTNTSELLKKGE